MAFMAFLFRLAVARYTTTSLVLSDSFGARPGVGQVPGEGRWPMRLPPLHSTLYTRS
jgi:hypothetical protein